MFIQGTTIIHVYSGYNNYTCLFRVQQLYMFIQGTTIIHVYSGYNNYTCYKRILVLRLDVLFKFKIT